MNLFVFYLHSYKYTLAELKPLFQTLTARSESYEDWASKVNKILKADQDNKSGELLQCVCLYPLEIPSIEP